MLSIIIIYTRWWLDLTRKCGFIKNFVRAVAVLSKVPLRFHISEPKIYHTCNVLKRLRIAPDCIFETLRECSYNYMYYLKDANMDILWTLFVFRFIHIITNHICTYCIVDLVFVIKHIITSR